jgi:hypothetical protein
MKMRIAFMLIFTLLLGCGGDTKKAPTLPDGVVWQGNVQNNSVALRRWTDSEVCTGIAQATPDLEVRADLFYCGDVYAFGCSIIELNHIIITQGYLDTNVMNHESLHILLHSTNEDYVRSVGDGCGFNY